MIVVGKPFWEKNSTLQNLHNILSNQDDYNTLAMQVLIGANHHNSSSERLLLAPTLQIELNFSNKPSFYSDFTTWKPLVVLQNHGKNYHATCYPFLTFIFSRWKK